MDPRKTPDPTLEQAYASQRDALRAFFRKRLHGQDLAEDLAQEVYLELRLHPPAETLRDPALYLYKIAWRILRRTMQATRRAPEARDPAELNELCAETTEDAAAELTAEEYLSHLLSELPPMYGAVLALHIRDGLTYEQVGARLGISKRSAKRHMEHALAHLRRAQW